jgi:alpha-L-rhamnosidase
MDTNRKGARQTAYRVLAASAPAQLSEGKANLWDSGKVESDQSVHVAYRGQRLTSRQRVYWKVTIWDERGKAETSDPAWFEMGLLKRSDWKARWIGAALRGGAHTTIPVPYLRKSFNLPGKIQSARLYVTALGLYECSINGQRVGADELNPGWTNYRKRVRYAVYDVATLLKPGENALGALLGDGWAVGQLGLTARQNYVTSGAS